MGDLTTLLYPWRELMGRAWQNGIFPLWNPYYQMGLPFFAEPQSALLYPPHLLYLILPTKLAWGVSFVLRSFLAGYLTFLCARALGCTALPAGAAGVIYAFSGAATSFQGRPQFDAALWLPLIILSIDRLQRDPRFPAVVLTAVAFSLPVLAGHPENALHAVMAGCFFVVWRAASSTERPGRERSRFLLLFTAAGFMAFALTAVQVLPTLEWLGEIRRNLDARFPHRPVQELVGFFSRDLGHNPNAAGVQIPEGANYAGLLTLLVAPFAFFFRPRRDVWFFTLLAIIAFEISYGFEPFWWISQHTPVLQGIPNFRLLIVLTFCLALLAGWGLTALEHRSEEIGRARWMTFCGAGVLVVGGIAWLILQSDPTASPPSWRASVSSTVLMGGVALGFLLLRTGGMFESVAGSVAAIIFVVIDLLTSAFGFIPFNRPAEIFPPNPTFEFLQRSEPSRFRAAGMDLTYGTNYQLVYGLFEPTGFDLPLRRVAALLEPLTDGGDATALRARKVIERPAHLLDIMNVKYLVAARDSGAIDVLSTRPERFRPVFRDGQITVFENRSVLERGYLVPAGGIVVVSDERERLARLSAPDFDPRRTVILERMPGPIRNDGGPFSARLEEIEHDVNRVTMTVSNSGPAVLVLSQMDYPGWKVSVDGGPGDMLRANYAFPAVLLAPGRHRVEFRFRPASVLIGAIVSLVALVATTAFLWRSRSKVRASDVAELS
jgi:hypothetical protein